ncbi:unnamed protein product [Acanthoscelides obtectus]|nr:unnamed protein product [Acanthoscelides obtectus]CAH1959893.1 unnamed protein product [Acanthoscelides obtectus]CAH2001571.1 unnamed protein product [Acanthoscelides obtectus]CAK1668968.1 Axin-1 [Acanthoscelides obtectus]CAK1668969.1 Axin-1 [Acanthoscelides obtectus]
MNEREKNKGSSAKQVSHEAYFDHKCPRPPVPGEERSHFTSDWDPPQQHEGWAKPRAPSPPIPVRKHCSYTNDGSLAYVEGAASASMASTSLGAGAAPCYSPPSACLRWTYSLRHLLQDPDGVRLFQQYLASEGRRHSDALDFWFACEGLRKQTAKEKIQQLVKVIYKKFFVKSALPIDEELRKDIGRSIKFSQCLEPPVTLFDKAQAKVEQLIDETTYPNFLKSDTYLQYLENVQNHSSSSSSDYSNELSNLANGPDPLPTLHEDMELIMNPPVHMSHTSGSLSTGYHTPNVGAGSSTRLTKELLLMSQKHRALDVRPKSETFASMFMYRPNTTGAHAAYNSYNPVSRQDSELHSLSSHSDARTESDNMSMTDSSL